MLWQQPAVAAPGRVFQTQVAPEPGEDLAAPCSYEMTLTDPSRTVKGAWVIFDRGRDMLRYYGDPDVQAFAQRHDLALVVPFHCRATAYEDIDVDPARGIGRALFTALSQFAKSSGHPELSSARVILLGFSGTGALVARFPEYAPDRVLAAISTDPGHFDPLGVDTINLSPRAAAVPQLIVTGGADGISGTQRPYAFFRRHFDQKSRWTFLVQNGIPHCCIINAKALVLEWLDATVMQGTSRDAGWFGFISTTPSNIDDCPSPRPAALPPWCHSARDTWGAENWLVRAAKIAREATPPDGMVTAGWMPTRSFARHWLEFISKAEHPITSLP
jgi:hypothetical protein